MPSMGYGGDGMNRLSREELWDLAQDPYLPDSFPSSHSSPALSPEELAALEEWRASDQYKEWRASDQYENPVVVLIKICWKIYMFTLKIAVLWALAIMLTWMLVHLF